MKHDYFAAIDIGTNAGRLLIGYVIPQNGHLSVKKALLTRLPLRLGEEVFNSGSISKSKEKMFMHTMHAFSHLLKAYQVKSIKAVATSAMREADNGISITEKIFKQTGIQLQTIDGEEEAEFIFATFKTQNLDQKRSYLFIDVGGGSTELTIIKDGKRIKSRSFKIGTIRLKQGKVDQTVWGDIEKWISKNRDPKLKMSAIGTGGNANRIVKISNKKYLDPVTLDEITDIRNHIARYSLNERVEKLRLKPDRADVIIPACDIYVNIIRKACINEMYVPKMGLADGIILSLYQDELAKL